MSPHPPFRRQCGVAVVLAMSVVALAAMAATALLGTQSLWARHAELAADRTQALLVVQAGLDWSRAVLSDDHRTSNVDHLGEPWALRLPPLPLENGSLAGHLEDQNGRFNLNNLLRDGKVNPAQLAHYRRLLDLLGLPATLAEPLVDWLDADGETYGRDGAEDAAYLATTPASLAGNRPLTDPDELALVRGYDETVRARLLPHVTALPGFAPVNVNTASPEVLAAVVDGLSLSAARAVVAQRDRAHARDRAEFRRWLPAGAEARDEDITVTSNYFMARVRVVIGNAEASGAALLARRSAGWPAILWRKSS
ncbi:MAG: type II secretion system minor pseudopilin GspK [Burkholderiales bacterium]